MYNNFYIFNSNLLDKQCSRDIIRARSKEIFGGFYMNKKIEVKDYSFKFKVNNKRLVLLRDNKTKKILFYGLLLTLMSSIIPLGKTKSDVNDENNINFSTVTLVGDASSLETATADPNNLILLATKPRKIKDVSKAELIKIDDGIYNTGKKIGCLNDTYYANLIYIEYYLANPGITYEEAIIRVNMGLWKPFYSFVVMNGSDFDEPEVLLNKYTEINQDRYNEDFDVSTLEKVGKTDFLLQSDAHDACEKMIKDAVKDGIKLTITSTFVSYKDQKNKYDAKVKKLGQKAAELVIERPGHSYAQIGTKVVFKVKQGSVTSKWLYNNAYKYGFVYVAPSGKSKITGYSYNPGAFHYVEIEYAKLCHDKKLTFDEVFHRYIFPGCVTFSLGEDDYALLPMESNPIYLGKSKTYSKF
jgi:D-alanyl-D-alanine carboxypeptidase